MKKLFAILTGAALMAGCHSRDASTGGTYDETRSMSGSTGTSVTQPIDNSQGAGGASLNNNASKPTDSSKPTDNGTPDSSKSQNDKTE